MPSIKVSKDYTPFTYLRTWPDNDGIHPPDLSIQHRSIVQISAMENNPEPDLPVRLMGRFVLAYETVDHQLWCLTNGTFVIPHSSRLTGLLVGSCQDCRMQADEGLRLKVGVSDELH